jgi:hypothetical protein
MLHGILFVEMSSVAVPGSENRNYWQLVIAGLLMNGQERIGRDLGADRLCISRQTWPAYFLGQALANFEGVDN